MRPRKPLHGGRPNVGQWPVDEDVRKELDFHIDMRAAELEAEGWDATEARREAERRFGNMSELSRKCREITRSTDRAQVRAGRLDALRQDLRYGLRVLRKSPAFALLATLTLALGIGANTAIFSLVYGVLLKPLPYPDSEQIVSIREQQPDLGRTMAVVMANFRDWHEGTDAFEALAAYNRGTFTVRGREQPFRVVATAATEDFLSVFRVVPLAGRMLDPRDFDPGAEPVALIGEALWTREFGQQPLDEIRMELRGQSPQVVGVLPASFDFPSGASVWTPLVDENTSRSAHNYSVVARLAPGTTIEQADAELDAIQDRVTAAERAIDPEFVAEAVDIRRLRESVSGRAGRPLGLLFGAAGLVLLIGCANLASTLLARGSVRSRELNLRQALGAGRRRVVGQLLAESCLLALFGAVAGLGLAQGLLTVVKGADGAAIPRLQEVSLDLRVLLFTGLAAILTGLLFGLLPAFRLSEADPGQALRSGDRGQGSDRRSRLWGPLVATEVALAFVLLTGSLLLVRSFQEVLDAERGFTTDGVLTATIDLDRARYAEPADQVLIYQQILDDLQAQPGIVAAGVASSVPLSGGTPNGRLELDGDLSKQATAEYVVASGGYFQGMGIPLLQGRVFDGRDGPDGAHVAIVSKAFADQYWPGEDPIGRQVTGGGMDEFWEERPFATVIGVVGDARYQELVRAPVPLVYFPFSQRPQRLIFSATLVARSSAGDAASLTTTVRSVLRSNDPSIPPRFQTMKERIRGSLAQRRFTMSLLGGFAGVALILSGIGIYGVVSFSVARRTREMGIRIALGGGKAQIRRMVQLQSMRAVGAGAVLGLLAAVVFGRVLESALFGVAATDPLTLTVAGLALLATAWAASAIPAFRSTRVNPITAMRSD